MNRILVLVAFLLQSLCLSATAAPVQTPHVEAELIAENTSLGVGKDNWLALRLKPEKGWHVYWRNPGDSGLPTKLAWTLPAGVTAGEIQWPYPEEESLGELTNYGYGEEVYHLVQITVPAGTASPVTLAAKASWLVCADVCIPGSAVLSLPMDITEAPQADTAWSQAFFDTRAHLPQPSPFKQASFQIEGDEFRLQFGPLPAGTTAFRFFPYDGQVVNHAGKKREVLEGEVARQARPISPDFVQAPASVQGVVVLHTADGEGAYEITAQPGMVAAVPATATSTVPDKAPAAAGTSAAAPTPAEAAPSLILALGLALLGGLILNLMPCVFPVLSLKALSVMRAGEQNQAAHRHHALAYTAGVLLTFAAVAGVLIALRAGGAQLGWGFQLQSPFVVALLVYLLFALGLSLSGAADFGARFMSLGSGLAAKPGLAGSFFTGALAVVVASPCTAPFMGTALGFALTQSPVAAIAIFLALGLGLALPFLLLGFVPKLAALLPKPGAWMETLKQFLAFPLYLSAVWLLWVLGGLTSRDGIGLALVGLTLIGFALWLAGRAGWFARALAIAAVLGAVALLFQPQLKRSTHTAAVATDSAWEPYSDARLAELRDQKRTVLVDFTADWCLTCKINERVAFKPARTQQVFKDRNVALLVGDWTSGDPAITAVLQRYARSGVPLYLVSKDGAEPVVLPQVLTPQLVAQALGAE